MFMSLSNNTTQWTQSFTQYFQGSGGGNNSRGGRIPALWRGLVTNTDGDYDARLRGTGADADPMTNAPWFDIENLSSNPGDPDTTFETVWNLANFPGVLDIPTRLDDAGNQIPFDVNVFFLRWVISLQDEIEDDNLLEIMARHAIQATFCTRNNGLTGPLRTAIGNGGDGAIPNEYTEPSDLNIRGACREFFRFFEDENFIPREAQISDDRYRFDPDSNFFQTAFLDIQEGDEDWIVNQFDSNGVRLFDPEGVWHVVPSLGGDPDNSIRLGIYGRSFTTDEYGEVWVDGDEANEVLRTLGGPDDYFENHDYEGEDAFLIPVDADGNEIMEDAEPLLVSGEGANPALIFVCRVLMDTFFEMEARVLLALNSNNVCFTRYSSEQRNNEDATLVESANDSTFVQPAGQRNTTPVADFLAEHRLEFMTGYLTSLSALSNDNTLRNMFDSEMMPLEVGWYSKTVSTRLLQAREREGVDSLLATPEVRQLQGAVPQLGLIQPQTILRTLDSPTLTEEREETQGESGNNFGTLWTQPHCKL